MKHFSDQLQVRVRYAETDQMGYVYYGNYAQYLELGRVEWLRKLGVSYRSMEDSGVMLPVVRMTIHYKSPGKYDDLLTVHTRLQQLPSVKIGFDYLITNETGETVIEAEVVLAFISMETNRPMKCPDYILDKLQPR